MSLKQWLPSQRHEIGGLGQFILSVYAAAAISFGIVLADRIKAILECRNVERFAVIGCHFESPTAFHPRLLVLTALFVAALGVCRRTFPRSAIVVGGLSGALSIYAFWWARSYQTFIRLSGCGVDFLNDGEIKQVAYLYKGTSFDFWIALSIFTSFVLSLDRLFSTQPQLPLTKS